MALPRILPVGVARRLAEACPLAQDKAPASFLGPGTSQRHTHTRAEPNTPATSLFALCPGLSLRTLGLLSAWSGAIGHMDAFRGSPAVSTLSVLPILLVVRRLYQGLGVAHNPVDKEIPSNFVFPQGLCQVAP